MINSFSSNWFTLLLLCTSAPLVLYCDRFDRGSRQVKRKPVDMVTRFMTYHFVNELGFITITQKIISLLVIGVHLGSSILYMKLIILPPFLEGAVFLKRRKMPNGMILSNCMWSGSCRWQPTTCLRWKKW